MADPKWTFQGHTGYLDAAAKGATAEVRGMASRQPAIGACANLLSQACTAGPSHRHAIIEQARRRQHALAIAHQACEAMIKDVVDKLDIPNIPDKVEGPPGPVADHPLPQSPHPAVVSETTEIGKDGQVVSVSSPGPTVPTGEAKGEHPEAVPQVINHKNESPGEESDADPARKRNRR